MNFYNNRNDRNGDASGNNNNQKHFKKSDITRFYDPPGELSEHGKRHDNDFVEISEISIIPTVKEILCDRSPFLPSSLPDAPHFLPDGAARLLDTQFRLLREDMLNPIRVGLSNFLNELSQTWSKELRKIQEEGGRYSGSNNGDLYVYPYIQFVNIICDRRKGFACTIRFTPPKIQNAKDEFDRREYWEKCKRLLTGNLVVLLLPSRRAQLNNFSNIESLYSIYFGIVTSRDEKILSKYDDHAEIDINFIDSSIYPIALNEISNYDRITKNSLEKRFLLESTNIYLEAYYHILKTLQSINPFTLPFKYYLAPNFDRKRNIDIKVETPMYTRTLGFQFDLSVLCKYEHTLKLNVSNTYTYDEVAKKITKYSDISKPSDEIPYGLDETQGN
jgi:hypothetical protein